jgi:hypothetical protein
VSALVSHLDGGHVVGGRSHEVGATFDGAAAEGVATVVGDPDSTVRTATVFESGAANADAVSSWASETAMYGDQSPETTTDGRVIRTTAAVPTDSFDQLPSDFPGPDIPETSDVPQVAFAFEYEETGDDVGLLTITHEGGDSVPAATLYLRGEGFATVDGADQTDGGQWQGDTSDEGTVQAGHAVDVGVTGDYELTVVWESESGDRSATLSANEGPEA